MYAVIDIETTGLGSRGNKITDISIFKTDGKKVLDEFHSLVYPESKISYHITKLTGITNEMVRTAPKFYEIANKVLEMTKDCVFVAHNVGFDFGVIKAEFKELGYDYNRERLCTVRLSRNLIPGHRSYSLGKLCNDLGIEIEGRHRAYGDAKATVQIFHKMYRENQEYIVERSKGLDWILPPLLDKEVVDNLPRETGVYYFYDGDGELIYVGKSIDIKKRVVSHFRDKSRKERKMREKIANVTYEVTGSELIALLKESAEIKKNQPLYNRSQKRNKEVAAIFSFTNGEGVTNLAMHQLRLVSNPLATFYSMQDAKSFMEKLAEQHELCHRYTQLEKTSSRCFHSHVEKCKGVCFGQEEIEVYNQRVKEAIHSIYSLTDNMLLIDEGRNEEETAFIWIQNSTYQGFGYVKEPLEEYNPSMLQELVIPQEDNRDVKKIISSFVKGGKLKQVIEG